MLATAVGLSAQGRRGVLWVAVLCTAGLGGCSRADRPKAIADSAVSPRVTPDTTRAQSFPVVRDSIDAARDTIRDITREIERGALSVPPPTAATDTARGVLRLVGAAPLTHMVLAPASGEPLALASPDSAVMIGLAAADGLEIMIRGERTAERLMDVAPTGTRLFRVRQFAVRAVDGVSARDGVLRRADGTWYLEMTSGAREPIVDLPVALRTQEGARVFLAGDPTRAPQAFGVLHARSRAGSTR